VQQRAAQELASQQAALPTLVEANLAGTEIVEQDVVEEELIDEDVVEEDLVEEDLPEDDEDLAEEELEDDDLEADDLAADAAARQDMTDEAVSDLFDDFADGTDIGHVSTPFVTHVSPRPKESTPVAKPAHRHRTAEGAGPAPSPKNAPPRAGKRAAVASHGGSVPESKRGPASGPKHPPATAAAASPHKTKAAGEGKGTPAKSVPTKAKKKPGGKQAVQDEWGFFDPNQCGFPALIAKLDAITETEETPRKRRP
jgi:hypothetical protein